MLYFEVIFQKLLFCWKKLLSLTEYQTKQVYILQPKIKGMFSNCYNSTLCAISGVVNPFVIFFQANLNFWVEH